MTDKKKILIIDDEKHMRESLIFLLSDYEDLVVLEAVDGHKGFELAKLERPDVLVTDNKMPVLPGEQTAKLFKSDPVTRGIPIIMLTGMKLTDQEKNMIKLDVNDFLEKPVNPWELVRTLEKYLGPLKHKI